MDSLSEALSINLQWKSFLHHCAQHAKQGLIDKIDSGVDVYWTKCDFMFLNGLFLSSSISDESDLCQRLEDINTYVKKSPPTFPWMLFIEPELVPISMREGLPNICLTKEFVYVFKVTCMQTTKLFPPIRPLPTAEVKFATSQQDIYDAVFLNLQAHNLDTSIAKNVLEHRACVTNFNNEICCLVYADGKLVSTATTVLLDKCLYVALVATSPDHRKLGYAEVAMRALVERALKMFPNTEQGVVLHATAIGRPVYERIGFKEISDLDCYVHKPSTCT